MKMCVDLECPICKKITQGMLFDEWWESDEKFARKYYSIQCMECDTTVNFEEEYKVTLELQNIKKEW